MAYVYRPAGKMIWMMQYYRNGKRIRRSSGLTDKRAALKVAAAREADDVDPKLWQRVNRKAARDGVAVRQVIETFLAAWIALDRKGA